MALTDDALSSSAQRWASAHPGNDAGDTIDGNLRTVGNTSCDVGYAQDRPDAALAREGGEVGRATAPFGDDARDVGERE